MTRLTDEQVAVFATYDQNAEVDEDRYVASLAQEVQATRRLCPECPMCGGSGHGKAHLHGEQPCERPHCFGCDGWTPCPDCDGTGRMDIGRWVALLLDKVSEWETATALLPDGTTLTQAAEILRRVMDDTFFVDFPSDDEHDFDAGVDATLDALKEGL